MHFTLPLVYTALLFATGSVAANIPQFSTETSVALDPRADGPGTDRDHPPCFIKDRSTSHTESVIVPAGCWSSKPQPISANVNTILRQVYNDFKHDRVRVEQLLQKPDATDTEKQEAVRLFKWHLEVNTEKIQAVTKVVATNRDSDLAHHQSFDAGDIGSTVKAVQSGMVLLVDHGVNRSVGQLVAALLVSIGLLVGSLL
ncbi:unnamed protein product [Tilletia controversa]|uniref:Uncharacterized protein n=3 Tax=Tilletia TaxID=13289 RepID=A0A8X7MLZ5_9BASI|nr:hypothetical protein CF336_g7621 [Tilletia laevis]KAE8184921.1 hypothetical protein CF328_g7706 [Tilletia controversa]KAE8247534.1 hypothetical protein A4X03_0g7024 [Tilletia caries]KAE8185866.1 hypothetical protein CF335_g7607 [Tilletia laevis]KAE8239898.1 hypothetical protein A4X06_0g7986 [Tilletia controversa]